MVILAFAIPAAACLLFLFGFYMGRRYGIRSGYGWGYGQGQYDALIAVYPADDHERSGL